MERGNGNTVLLTVIGVATLLVALVGATFAYFTASVTNEASPVTVTTQEVAGLALTSVESNNTNVGAVPGIVGYKAYQVHATGSGSAIYSLSVDFTGAEAFGQDLTYSVCKVQDSDTALASTITNSSAAAAGVFKYVPGTYTVTTPNGSSTTQYSIPDSDVALPTECATEGNMIANNQVFPTTAGTVNFATSKPINAGSYDLYYVIYKYANTDSQQNAQNATFTISAPAFTVVNA